MLHADLKLAQRLEQVEALTNRFSVEAAAQVRPESGATAAPFMGGWAMFDGPLSPISQCFGLGLHGEVTPAEMDAVEDFFRSRGANCHIELCPHVDASLIRMLGERGYRVLEYSNVLVRPMASESEFAIASDCTIRPVESREAVEFSAMILRGFCGDQIPPGMESLQAGAFVNFKDSVTYVAKMDGRMAGGGSASFVNEVVNCFGDATLDQFRGRGIQSALIAARLQEGARRGMELAMATTMPGTVSQRNYERAGFRVAYTRCKFSQVRGNSLS